MALIHSMESSGNVLFKYRGQIPVVLFILAIPFVYWTDYNKFDQDQFYILTIIAILVSVIGFLVRGYAIGTTPKNTSGRNREEQVAEVLNHTGIYSTVRHPLYLGNYLIWIGIVIFTFNIYFIIIVSLLFWIYYERIMFAEERFLERKFGQQYIDWSLKVPAFIPSFKNYRKGETPYSWKTVLRREYSGFLATVLGFIFVDLLRIYFTTGSWMINDTHLIILGVSVLITLLLRSLKRYTKVLHVSDRS